MFGARVQLGSILINLGDMQLLMHSLLMLSSFY